MNHLRVQREKTTTVHLRLLTADFYDYQQHLLRHMEMVEAGMPKPGQETDRDFAEWQTMSWMVSHSSGPEANAGVEPMSHALQFTCTHHV